MVPLRVALAAGLATLVPVVAQAATDAEVAQLRAEIAALKAEYADRVGALEARINQLETTNAAAASAAAAAPAVVEAPPPAPAPAKSASAFNPAISVILMGNYTNLSQDPAGYYIAGFMPPDEGVGPGDRSFNLGESEVTLAASIDPYFTGALTAALTSDNEISVEEAYFRTLALPAGFSIKGGRFFSGFGYLNEVHAHAWDFVDQPLVYQAFFGGQMAQDGLQAKWLAPTDFFLEFGAETGNGEFFPGTRLGRNGANGATAYVHVGSDIGDSATWRGGLSYVYLDAEDRSFADENSLGEQVANAFSGTSKTWVVDAELKWTAPGDPRRRYLKLQGEYMYRTEDGELSYTALGPTLDGSYRSNPSGWYLQGVYQFLPRWRFGLRYDSLDSGDTRIGLVQSGKLTWGDFPMLVPATPSRTTLMFDWSLSEFSRLRAQYAWDDAAPGPTDDQFFLQYIYALGAHGAHKF
ncbi:MAG: hypothetical protein FIB04_11515 [Gammaproteobacteria bacterium]|nr:hypothetical protein [Gammaproteobacteria bacterium]